MNKNTDVTRLLKGKIPFLLARLPHHKPELFRPAMPDETCEVEFIPFAQGEKAGFVRWDRANTTIDTPPLPTPYAVDIEEYQDYFATAIETLRNPDNTLTKVVLSRVKKGDTRISDPLRLFDKLCKTYPTACCTLYSTGHDFRIGASPETLMHWENGLACCDALAGTRPWNLQETYDWTSKEEEEQRWVTHFLTESMRNLGMRPSVSKRTTRRAGNLVHLHNTVSVATEEPESLLASLHPTPAVSGYPQKEAIHWILKHEPHEREYYAGYIRFRTPENALVAYVNLRCARIIDEIPYLFVGGGITADSNLLSEWSETERKAETLLNVIWQL